MSDKSIKAIPVRQNMSAPGGPRRAFTMPEATLPDPPSTADAPEPTAQPARPAPTAVNLAITAVYQGYTITVAFPGSITQIPSAIERLRAIGATPTAQPAQQWAYTPEGLPICPKHSAPMKRREKQGDTWYSHVVTARDGEDCYCRGYAGKDSPGYEY